MTPVPASVSQVTVVARPTAVIAEASSWGAFPAVWPQRSGHGGARSNRAAT